MLCIRTFLVETGLGNNVTIFTQLILCGHFVSQIVIGILALIILNLPEPIKLGPFRSEGQWNTSQLNFLCSHNLGSYRVLSFDVYCLTSHSKDRCQCRELHILFQIRKALVRRRQGALCAWWTYPFPSAHNGTHVRTHTHTHAHTRTFRLADHKHMWSKSSINLSRTPIAIH